MALGRAGTLPHMDTLSDRELIDCAVRMFRQGLLDGRDRERRTADAVMLLIPPYPRRVIHKRKMRQVYGAGYDISRCLRELAGKGQD